MSPARAGGEEHREENQRDHHGAAEVGLFENHQGDWPDDQKNGERTVLELADSLLAFAEELGEKKYQREFHQVGRLRDYRAKSEPSARAALHQAEPGNIEQHEHHDRRDENRHHDSAQARERKLRKQDQDHESRDDVREMKFEEMKRVALFLDAEKISCVEHHQQAEQ